MTLPLKQEDLREAAERLKGRIHLTPLMNTHLLGEMINANLLLKCELFQKTGSYKPRGALNRLLKLNTATAAQGCVTISAGNFAQALAWAGREAGISTTVVMPAGASPTKAAASEGYGAQVILRGTVHEAFALAERIAQDEGRLFVHPFDHADIIAGTGTIGLELIEQCAAADIVVVPVGGGGLIGGIANALALLSPGTRVYGVEPEGAAAMRASLDAGHAVHLDNVFSVADGLAPPMAGVINYAVVSQAVADVVLVSDAEIVDAMGLIWSRTKLFAEPSGAAGIAALLNNRIPDVAGKTVVAIISGGNVNMNQLTAYAEQWSTS